MVWQERGPVRAWRWTLGAAFVAGAAALLHVAPAAGQSPDRLWGEVLTAAGERHTGYLRWDRNEAGWADLLDGERTRDPELVDRIAVALGDEAPERTRSVEFLGVRISWDDDEGTDRVASAVRFARVQELRTVGDDRAILVLKGGGEVEFLATSTDVGSGLRELVVEVPGSTAVELAWRDVDRIRFGPVPGDAADPGASRLHGTVQDRWGERWTGYLSWDRDEALTSDVLDGDEGGEDREIRFELVAGIERRDEGGARVLLRNGRELVLTGSNDVDDGHRGVQISDPGLGAVEVPWDSFASVRFHPPAEPWGYDALGSPAGIRGTVEAEGGARYTGRIVWDGDETSEWEMLDGSSRGVSYSIEFAQVSSVEKLTSRSARVTLRDGRVIELGESNDVDRGNRGIVIEGDDGSFDVVDWRDFRRADFGGSR